MAGGGPTVRVTFAGDADALTRAARQAQQATEQVGDSALGSGDDMRRAAGDTEDLTSRMSKMGNIVDGASTAVADISGAFQAFADVQDMARQKQQRLERALNDVAQAQEDYNQAVLDGKQATVDATQAGIDARQAQLDAETAELDYAAAVKEFGANSVEAKQALLDRDQSQADLTQATIDGEQALRDQEQATIDAKSAQLDLNDAQHEADPGPLQVVADAVSMFAPLLSGLVGVLGLVTVAQWAWNAAQLASPLTWIILAIVGLIAVIVLIATQTTWFQDLWTAAWEWIRGAAEDVWNWLQQVPGWIGDAFAAVGEWISAPFRDAWQWVRDTAQQGWDFIRQIPGWVGDAFASVASFISAPFRSAFNFVADAWNNTIGRLSWTVPGWVPFIGGNTISVPKLPRFHTGGVVPGTPGQEVMALLQAGERVIPRGGDSRGGGAAEVRFTGNTNTAFATQFMQLVRTGVIQIR